MIKVFLDTPRPIDTAVYVPYCRSLQFSSVARFQYFHILIGFTWTTLFHQNPLVQTKLQIPRQEGWFLCRLSDGFQSGLIGDQHPKSLSIWSKGPFKHFHNKPRHCRHANDARQRPRLCSISIIPLRKMSIKAKPRHNSSTSLRSILPVHPHDS
jgi:hypothetical protein